MALADAVARNAKAVVCGISGLLTLSAVGATLFSYAPVNVAGAGTAALALAEILRAVNVWLVQNEPLLQQVVTSGAGLADRIGAVAESAATPVPSGTS